MIPFKETTKNNHLTKYDDVRVLVLRNYIKEVPSIQKKKLDSNKQTLLSEHTNNTY